MGDFFKIAGQPMDSQPIVVRPDGYKEDEHVTDIQLTEGYKYKLDLRWYAVMEELLGLLSKNINWRITTLWRHGQNMRRAELGIGGRKRLPPSIEPKVVQQIFDGALATFEKVFKPDKDDTDEGIEA